MKKISVFLIFALIIIGCDQNREAISTEKNTKSLEFVKKVTIEENENALIIHSGGESVSFSKNELPLKSAMVIPTSVMAFMDVLDLTDKIIGIGQPDKVYNAKIRQNVADNKTENIASFDEIFIEKVLTNKPDVFISITGLALTKYHDLLKKQGIKVLTIDEYEEAHPLARAEYIKIIGMLFGKENEADTVFEEIKNNYEEIKSLVKTDSSKNPTVLANQIYGDVWYMPGGKSFQALLFEDAGGDFIWASDDSSGSLNLSFETVFEKANDADIWMNAGDFPSLAAMKASYPNYEWFSSFKNGDVYNWNQRITESGANDYFEMGVVRPDWVLKDLAAVFHPELFPKHELYFYKRLK